MYHSIWNASCIFLVLGLITLIAGYVIRTMAENKERFKGRAEAKVVELLIEPMDTERQSEFHNSQVAIFEYVANGKLFKVRERKEDYPSRFSMNEIIRIRYNVSDPREYEIERPSSMARTGMAVHIAGITMVVTGCLFFFLYAVRFY